MIGWPPTSPDTSFAEICAEAGEQERP
jgi:hypothetical protein